MKKILFPLLFLFSFTSLFAQPVNDDCAGLIDLGTIPLCPDSVWYTNVNATESDIGSNNFPTGCDGGDITFVGRDVWFQFTTNDTLIDVNITVTGIADPMGSTPMSNPQIAVYRGDCLFDELSLLKCGKSADGSSELSLDVIGLDPNTPYFIRVNDWSASATPNSGSFQLCLDEQDPEFTVCEDFSSSTTGVLYDCGGPDGDYSNNTSNSFTICPDALTGSNQSCITFGLQYFNLETNNFGGGDFITFYDGPNTSSPIISNVGNNGIGDDGGGGVCFVAQASSGCMTVEFTTNSSVTFEGFCGAWDSSIEDCPSVEVIDVTSMPTNQDLANFVTTPQTMATITNVDCEDGQYGTFTADNTDLGLEKGIILTTGSIDFAVGPNLSESSSDPVGAPGDLDLDSLSILSGNTNLSQDACVIELDVFVATNELSFEYVFGSEEYPEFVNQNFNDIFALLVSGPGIVGQPGIGNQQNVATLPNTAIPVEINSVNPLLNSEYYRYNTGGQSIGYDGLTSDFLGVKKSLSASIPVIPCTTYHLKFAIADRGDSALDSGVFIGELKGDIPSLVANFTSGVDYLVEDCTGVGDELQIVLQNPQQDSQLYDVTITGSAELGVDYTLNIPSQVVVAPGETILTYQLIPLTDGITEGIENIIVTLTNNFGCGNVELSQIEIEIHDQPLIEIFTGADTAYLCDVTCLEMEVSGAVNYEWESTLPGVFDDPFSASPTACPTESQWVSVTGFITSAVGCNATDSVYLQSGLLDIDNENYIEICLGDSVLLTTTNSTDGLWVTWTPDDFLDTIAGSQVWSIPTETTTYIANLSTGSCSVSDTVTIRVDSLPDLAISPIPNKPVFCKDEIVNLVSTPYVPGEYPDIEFFWDPAIGANSDLTNFNLNITATETFTFMRRTTNKACMDSSFYEIIVIDPNDITITPSDTLICPGETVQIVASSPDTEDFTWTPGAFLDCDDCPNPVVTINSSQSFTVEADVQGCLVTATASVQVQEQPDYNLPDLEPICLGETSPSLNLTGANNSTYSWTSNPPGFTSTLAQPTDNPSVTTTYYMTMMHENGLCGSIMDSLTLIVNGASTLDVIEDMTLCEGDSLNLFAESNNSGSYTWSNGAAGSDITAYGTDLGEETYTVTFISGGNCDTLTESVVVTTVDAIRITGMTLDPDQDTLNEGQIVNFLPSFSPVSPPSGTTYNWSTGGISIGTASTLTDTILGTPTTSIIFVTTSPNGCMDSWPTTFTVIPAIKALPNAFTPNRDGNNDRFKLLTSGQITISSFQVFSRWGQKVYDDVNPDGWNGTFKGKPMPSDVYIYRIVGFTPSEPFTLEGEVTLIR